MVETYIIMTSNIINQINFKYNILVLEDEENRKNPKTKNNG